MNGVMLAAFWGFVGGSALLLGAAVGYYTHLKQRIIAGIMAFGSGVLISALTLELMNDAYKRGGILYAGLGFLLGATIYTLANLYLATRGAKHRKRSGGQQISEKQESGSGAAIAIGSLLDGIPESIVIGLTLLSGGHVNAVAVTAVFLSNIPEGLSSASGMKKAGRSPKYIFGVWAGIALTSGIASLAGYSIFSHFSPTVVAATTALAAGAILTMLVDTMIPEAFEYAQNLSGLITVLGFLISFFLSKID